MAQLPYAYEPPAPEPGAEPAAGAAEPTPEHLPSGPGTAGAPGPGHREPDNTPPGARAALPPWAVSPRQGLGGPQGRLHSSPRYLARHSRAAAPPPGATAPGATAPGPGRPSHGDGTPPPCAVPGFAPIRVSAPVLGRLVRSRRRALAAGLATTAAALIAAGPRGEGQPPGQRQASKPRRTSGGPRASGPEVTAPVRIADVAAARLLRPGDRVDVIAADGSAGGPPLTRVVARAARVLRAPRQDVSGGAAEEMPEAGALVLLRVPRATAVDLAAAGAASRLAVTLC